MADSEQDTETAAVEEASRYWDEAVAASEGRSVKEEDQTKPEEPQEKEEKKAEPEAEEEPAESTEKTEDEEEDGEDAEGEPEEPEDPWAAAPEVLRKEHEAALEKAKKFEHEARSNRGRFASLEKKYKELSSKLESAPAKDEKKEPTISPVDSIFETPKWKKFELDFGADVADPTKEAMRQLYEEMHSRNSALEERVNSLLESRSEQQVSTEIQKFNQDFQQWIGNIHDGYEVAPDEPLWFPYVRDNYHDLEAFAQTDDDYLKWWTQNEATITKPNNLLKLFREFEASRGNSGKKEKRENSAPKPNGASPKTEPRALTPKRKLQQTSAASMPPRSAPGPGRRSNDLPDPEDYANAFEHFAAKATR